MIQIAADAPDINAFYILFCGTAYYHVLLLANGQVCTEATRGDRTVSYPPHGRWRLVERNHVLLSLTLSCQLPEVEAPLHLVCEPFWPRTNFGVLVWAPYGPLRAGPWTLLPLRVGVP